jgi:hypothetical protein
MYNRASFYRALTGYIDNQAAKRLVSTLPKIECRSTDIVYRATRLPYWFGSHGQLKHHIADIIREGAKNHHLTFDISTSEADTIVGEGWLDFIASEKAIIGCESGSSALDRRGEIKAKLQALLLENPSLTFEQADSGLPPGWNNFSFFAISPRHLEAVITKTCQILVEGSYNGILKPNIHYIQLKRDFSDIDDALEKMKNPQLLEEITERAYADIYLSNKYSYKTFASQIEQVIN